MQDVEIPDLYTMLESGDIVNAIIDSTGLKIFGVGEWQECKYNLKKRKGWCRLHIVIDQKSKKIIASELTTNLVWDATALPLLLNKINKDIASVTADGAYDIEHVYKDIADRNAIAVIPPKENAVLSNSCIKNSPNRVANMKAINTMGRKKWQKVSGYNWRSLVETTIGRYKKIIGPRIYSKKFVNQKNESRIGCYILNKMTEFGVPETFKIRASN